MFRNFMHLLKILGCFVLFGPWHAIQGQTFSSNTNSRAFENPESLVQLLYEQVTFPPNTSPDWDLVKTMFIEEAVIVLRTGKEKTSQFTVEEWIQDFVDFIENAKIIETGFEEKILKIKTTAFGDVAQCWVLYKAEIPGRGRSNQGVDSFHLIKREGRWWIVSILNEIPGSERPAPKVW
jgi:hypothetical protein